MSIIKGPIKSSVSPSDTTLTTILVKIPAASLTSDLYIFLDITTPMIPPPIFHYLITIPGLPPINGSGPILSPGIKLGKGSDLLSKIINVQSDIAKGAKGNTANVKYNIGDNTGSIVNNPIDDNVTGLNPSSGIETFDTNINFK